MYRDEYHPQVKKDLKKLDKSLHKEIISNHLSNILSDPERYDTLSGVLEGIYSYHFKKNKVDYRICYLIKENQDVVFILMIGKRENLYKILKRRIK